MSASEAQSHVEAIRRLYTAIKAHNLDEIAACYHPDAHFKDIAYDLSGKPQVMQMWQMICMKTRPKVTFDQSPDLPAPTADAETGSGRWRAEYHFGKTEAGKFGDTKGNEGRPVDNWLTSTFKFEDGLIVDHQDTCNVLRWAWQAIPFPKSLFAAALPKKRQAMAQEKLKAFIASLPPAERARFAAAPAPAPAPPV